MTKEQAKELIQNIVDQLKLTKQERDTVELALQVLSKK